MKIEKMNQKHLDEVHKIEQECFSHPWSLESLESEMKNENSLFLVAVEDGKVIGYIGMSIVIDEGYIFNVAVCETQRQRGVATALITSL